MSSPLILPDDLRDALLDGTFGSMAPVVRVGNDRYLRYDEIVITHGLVTFRYRKLIVASVETDFETEGTLTISNLEGRIKMKIV